DPPTRVREYNRPGIPTFRRRTHRAPGTDSREWKTTRRTPHPCGLGSHTTQRPIVGSPSGDIRSVIQFADGRGEPAVDQRLHRPGQIVFQSVFPSHQNNDVTAPERRTHYIFEAGRAHVTERKRATTYDDLEGIR